MAKSKRQNQTKDEVAVVDTQDKQVKKKSRQSLKISEEDKYNLTKPRCPWALQTIKEEVYMDYLVYHDTEWGRLNLKDDNYLFEKFVMETQQAGLSFLTVLRKRKGYQDAFEDFNIDRVAEFDDSVVEEYVTNDTLDIIRQKAKIQSILNNARQFQQVQKEYGSFGNYILEFVPNKQPYSNNEKRIQDLPKTAEWTDILSKDLKKKGFKFVGPIMTYSFCQGVGLINDHTTECICYQQCKKIQLDFNKKQKKK